MDRLIRLNQMWSWLPAFRAVAETQHLHQAAALVHLTPSTLSRAVHLLEDNLGRSLFRRVGRSIELTDDGQLLLLALRDAMRRLDDAVVAVTQRQTGPLRVAADDAVALAAVVAALSPELSPELSPAGADVTGALKRGSIDVAFVMDAPAASNVLVERIGELSFSLYGTASLSSPSAGDTSSLRVIDAPGLPWPPERARTVQLRVAGAALALAACHAGAGVAMLPDCLARGLLPVRGSDGRPLVSMRRPVYALRRPPLTPGGSVAALIAAVRARLQQPVRELAMDVVAATA